MRKWIQCLAMSLVLAASLAWNAPNATAQDNNALDAALDARWNTADVPAVEGNLRFVTEKTVELGVSFGYQPNDDYANVFPILLDAIYHINSDWGVGVRGSILVAHSDTELKTFLDDHQPGLDSRMLYEDQLGDIAVMGTYRPLYGKWTAGATNLGRFDWGILAGLGAVFVDAPNKARSAREKTAHFEGILGMDAHIFFKDWLALRLEASLRLYEGTDRFMVPCFLGVGLSFMVPTLAEEVE